MSRLWLSAISDTRCCSKRRNRGVPSSYIKLYAEICSTSNSMAFCKSVAHSLTVCFGNPKIRSMLILPIPTCLSLCMAGSMSAALCLLRKKFNRSSEKVCTPILIRLTGRQATVWANWGVRSSGLHSIVTSAVGEM